jgi:hypothetical protein
MFFFSLKNIVSFAQENQITGSPSKKHVFLLGANFVKSAKNHESNIFKKKKKYTPQFVGSSRKKNFSSIGRSIWEKNGRNFDFSVQKLNLRKMQRKLYFFDFSSKTSIFFRIFCI